MFRLPPPFYSSVRIVYVTNDVREMSVGYNRLCSITAPMQNRTHCDAAINFNTPDTAFVLLYIHFISVAGLNTRHGGIFMETLLKCGLPAGKESSFDRW